MGTDFIREIVANDLASGRYGGRVLTRFPPEPNGYLHLGHAASICLNFGIALENDGACNLRFDDTNPHTEDIEYVEAIQNDVRWLGFDFEDRLFFASDYFERLYEYAIVLIRKGKAYVDSSSEEEIREMRGSVTRPGTPSAYRDRSVDDNLDLFRSMRAGEFEDGTHVLRAKIDLAHPNMVMRDPVLYRIRHAHHYRTGDAWCLYPLYDFTHCLSDAIEDITHSICTMEFENNRELYDWILDEVGFEEPRPHQYEFARREFANTVVSKRKLLRLVEEGHVRGWDDPRMPTLSGLRRRGVTPEAIRSFCDMIGVSKTENLTDIGKLEYAIRDDLNPKVPRVMCVLDPLKVVVTSYPEGQVEELDAPLYPHDVPLEGSRTVPFSRELYIERGDFRENPPKGFFRLAPGREVRLRYGYLVTCTDIVRGDQGEIVELHCTHDPESRGGNAPDGRRVRGTIHWVSAERSVPCEVRLYDRLFTARDPDAVDEGEDFLAHLNPDALVVRSGARIEPSVRLDPPGTRYQFERLGYFISDVKDSTSDRPVYNRTVTLRDNWGKRSLEAEESKPASTATRVRKDEPEDRPTGPPKPPDRTAEEEARFIRFRDGFGLRERAAHVFATDPMLGRLFEEAVKGEADEDAVAKWIVNDVLREMGDRTISETRLTPEALAELVGLVESRTLSTRLGREVLREVIARGGSPTEIGERLAADQVTDPEVVAPIIERLVVENTDKAEAFRQGQDGLLGFFIGQTMRETNGKADPKMVRRLVLEALGGTER